MTSTENPTDLHLVLRLSPEGATLEAGPFTYGKAVERYEALRTAAVSPGRDLYAVRSMDDPKFAHLAPKVYPSAAAATKALARQLHPGDGYGPRAYLAAKLGWENPWGRGWSSLARAAQDLNYVGGTYDGRAYLTSLAATLPAFNGSYS